MTDTRKQGQSWERAAERFLREKGLCSVTRNFGTRFGEIDLIMLDDATLVFVEVRYRARSTHGSGAASVTPVKQRRIAAAARYFLKQHRQHALRPCRFDVVSIGQEGEQARFDWIRSAFEAA